MLESLDKIDAQELRSVHSQVRTLINELITHTTHIRDEAIDTLYHHIWHQNTLDEDTISAVQLLIERLQAVPVHDKEELLLLLAYIARGNSYTDAEQHTPDDTHEQNTAEHQAQTSQIRDAHNAVAEGVPVYLSLLKHNEPTVRMCAAYTLGCLREHASTIIPTLRSSINTENDELAKSSMLLCLSALRDEEPPKYQQLLSEITKEQANTLVTLAASMALAKLAKENTPPEAIQVLVDTIVEPDSTIDTYTELPWATSDIVGDTSHILYTLGPHAAHIAIPILVEALKTASPPNSLNIVDALLYLAFNGKAVNTDITAQTLTAEQKLVLSTIANSDCAWVLNVIHTGATSG